MVVSANAGAAASANNAATAIRLIDVSTAWSPNCVRAACSARSLDEFRLDDCGRAADVAQFFSGAQSLVRRHLALLHLGRAGGSLARDGRREHQHTLFVGEHG